MSLCQLHYHVCSCIDGHLISTVCRSRQPRAPTWPFEAKVMDKGERMNNLTRISVSTFLLLMLVMLVAVPASAYTTELTVTKLANDGVTVLDQQTVDIAWMEANLPVYGDGVTHYYHQGPVFIDDTDDATEQALRWNPEEDVNVLDKDMGAVKGTNLKDLCDLVGGMNDGEEVLVVADDGFSKPFAWENVYNYTSREGPMVVTWYVDGLAAYPSGSYPDTGYSDGMRIVWFADNATNPWGVNAFGNYDWFLAAEEPYWYYFYQGPEKYPTTTGLSVKYVAEIRILSDDPAAAPVTDVLYDGPVTLSPGATFDVVAYNSAASYTVNEATPLGALEATALTYDVTDKNYAASGALLLDNVDAYPRDKTNATYWYAYVNDVYMDGYNNAAGALNLIELAGGDTVEYYYATGIADPTDLAAVQAAAIAAVLTVADVETAPVLDVLYDGPVTLSPGATFEVTSYVTDPVGITYTVNETTPLGALEATGLSYAVSDKRYPYDGVLLLDDVATYLRKSPGSWYAYVNDVYKDGYQNTPAGLNVIELTDGDTVEYYYAEGIADPSDLAAVQAAATAAVLTVADIEEVPTMDVLYDGPVTLTAGATFEKAAYNSGAIYTVNETTPLGALEATGLIYDVTDKNYGTSGALLLDNVGSYLRKAPGYWYAYVNAVYMDGYNNPAGALNLIEVSEGDTVEYYYAADVVAATDLAEVQGKATAAVKTVVAVPLAYDVIFDGTVSLDPDATFEKAAYNSGAIYTVNEATPLGALEATALTYDVTDKNYATSGALLLDNVDAYPRDKTNATYWYAYVNDVYMDGYNNAAGALNLIELADGDRVEFYYAEGVVAPSDLAEVKSKTIAAVLTVASTGVTPDTWTLELSGAMDETVSKAFFEEGLACPSSGHYVEWTDDDMNVWGGIPLWVLVAMVDDNPDVGPDHFNFNDDIAATDYEVEVISGDGWSTTLSSVAIARNDGYLVANTLNGEELPLLTDGGKPFWPLQLKGSAVFGGQQVGNIARIELSGLPAPVEGWTLALAGEVGDTITQSEFEDGLACPGSGHYVEWTDDAGATWSGVPLWVLLGAVDDYELSQHWTFSDEVAAGNYTINVIAGDGYTRTFYADDVARNDGYLVANKVNGTELDADGGYPLKLNGPAITSGKDRIGSIAAIEIVELQTPPAEPGSYNLAMNGIITDVLSQAEFEAALACPYSGHAVEWTDADGNVWSGMPLWFLTGWVDDRLPHAYDSAAAMAGYTITVKAGDGYSKAFASADVAWSDGYIVANQCNGAPLEGSWPLRLVGDGVATDGVLGGKAVGQIAEIELTEFAEPTEIPQLHIVKYGADGQTVVDEVWIDYTEMMTQFDVIGDGATVYSYQAVTMDPEDIWGEFDETKGGTKIANAVKGTRVVDLVGLVGGMGEGTDIVFIASDGWQTVLPYTSVYTTPEIYEHQGDAVLAWYADGEYVPGYKDGMRLFFMPDDLIFGQWDMHESIPEGYWHYYYQSYSAGDPVYGAYAPGILYPSCAGLSAKYITEIAVYSAPETDWNLQLDGTRIGGLNITVNKGYFEAALTCTFGANHEASYTDGSGNVWTGMPLFFLQGFVDDADQHSSAGYNQTLAEAGYDVIVTATDGYAKTFDSRDTIRSTGYLVANTLNGYHIPEDDVSWPLRLLVENVSKSENVKAVGSIVLNYRPNITAIDVPASAIVGDEVLLAAYFTDPYDTHTAVIDWGDNESSDGIVDEGDGMAAGSHAYAMAGTYTVNVTVTDSAGAMDMQSAAITVESPTVPPTPIARTMALREYIMAQDLHDGTETSLLAKLDAAMKQMEKNPKTAANILGAFVNSVEAQDGKKIPSDVAMYLKDEANAIIAMLMGEDMAAAPPAGMQQAAIATTFGPNDGGDGPEVNGANNAGQSNNDNNAGQTNNDNNAGQSNNDNNAGQSNNDNNAGQSNNDNSAGQKDNAGSNGNHLGQTKDQQNNGKGNS